MIWLVEGVCLVLIVAGLTLMVRAPSQPPGSRRVDPAEDPRTYIRRIAGMMLAAFGLALGLIVGLFYWS